VLHRAGFGSGGWAIRAHAGHREPRQTRDEEDERLVKLSTNDVKSESEQDLHHSSPPTHTAYGSAHQIHTDMLNAAVEDPMGASRRVVGQCLVAERTCRRNPRKRATGMNVVGGIRNDERAYIVVSTRDIFRHQNSQRRVRLEDHGGDKSRP
jgi:hypothetical protein